MFLSLTKKVRVEDDIAALNSITNKLTEIPRLTAALRNNWSRSQTKGNKPMTTNPLEILFHIIWIITEADRSSTTILLPDEY